MESEALWDLSQMVLYTRQLLFQWLINNLKTGYLIIILIQLAMKDEHCQKLETVSTE